MEQAREAAHAVSEFFQGNPMQTPVGQKIEQASETSSSSDNWAQYMEICDMICTYEDGPKDAVRAIRKRLQQSMGKNATVASNTLVILDTCVKNCGPAFYRAVSQKDFVQELVRLIGTKYDPPLAVQAKVLLMIKQWAEAFRGNPECSGACEVYDELISKGVEFPSQDAIDAPIVTPKATHPVTLRSNLRSQPVTQSISDQQLAKLRSELDIVNGNLSVFREMLSELQPGAEDPDDLRLLEDLNETCREMQKRIVELVECISDDAVTSELLLVNDELNTVFARYDRYMKNRQSAAGTARPAVNSGQEHALIDLNDAVVNTDIPCHQSSTDSTINLSTRNISPDSRSPMTTSFASHSTDPAEVMFARNSADENNMKL